MPDKLSTTDAWPTLVRERLTIWGNGIRVQRLRQRITVADLCERLGISRTTLLRLERGEPGASAGAYIAALLVLGIVDQAAPSLPPDLWQGNVGQRVRPVRGERGDDDADYF